MRRERPQQSVLMPSSDGSDDLGCLGCGFLPPDCVCDWDDCAAYQEALANPLPAHVAPLWLKELAAKDPRSTGVPEDEEDEDDGAEEGGEEGEEGEEDEEGEEEALELVQDLSSSSKAMEGSEDPPASRCRLAAFSGLPARP